ncbi:hypothetical protein FGO68_gene12036 [Halteria grandinella]|uniref:Uncharacterized protein n=1 Tax=Halteria grandinella TaxID=5974 RepID=A0A8J8T524_HALGN|nr:hypothetical protein FGO68_gene12036 [Halteria grandinella]
MGKKRHQRKGSKLPQNPASITEANDDIIEETNPENVMPTVTSSSESIQKENLEESKFEEDPIHVDQKTFTLSQRSRNSESKEESLLKTVEKLSQVLPESSPEQTPDRPESGASHTENLEEEPIPVVSPMHPMLSTPDAPTIQPSANKSSQQLSLESIKEEDEEQPDQPNLSLPKQQEYIKLEEHSSEQDSVASCRYQRQDLTETFGETNRMMVQDAYQTPEITAKKQREDLTTTASSVLEESLNKLQNLHQAMARTVSKLERGQKEQYIIGKQLQIEILTCMDRLCHNEFKECNKIPILEENVFQYFNSLVNTPQKRPISTKKDLLQALDDASKSITPKDILRFKAGIQSHRDDRHVLGLALVTLFYKQDLSLTLSEDKGGITKSSYSDIRKYLCDANKVVNQIKAFKEAANKEKYSKKIVDSINQLIGQTQESKVKEFSLLRSFVKSALDLLNYAPIQKEATPKLAAETPNKPTRTFISYASITPARPFNPPQQDERPSAFEVKFTPSLGETPSLPLDTTKQLEHMLVNQKVQLGQRRSQIINELYEQETNDLKESHEQVQVLTDQQKLLLNLKSVALKMNFQIEREDRQALQDATNREDQDYLEYQRQERDLLESYKQQRLLQDKQEDHEIWLNKIEDKKWTMEEHRRYVESIQKDLMRTEIEFAHDQKYQRDKARKEQAEHMRRMTDSLNQMTEIKESKLLNFVEEHASRQVERQFARQRELDHAFKETKQQEEQTRRELEYLMKILQTPKRV